MNPFDHPIVTLAVVGVVACLLFAGKLDGVIASAKRSLAKKPAPVVQPAATIHTPPQETVQGNKAAYLAAKYDRYTLATASILAAKAFAEQQDAAKAAEVVLTDAHNFFAAPPRPAPAPQPTPAAPPTA